MDKKELLESMDDLLSVLNQLREAAFRKQRALIENSFERIESSVREEEKILSELQVMHKRRVFILNSISKSLSIDVNNNKFSDFLKAVKGKIAKEYYEQLLEKNSALGALLGSVNLLNLQNRYLTEQARSFNHSLINELFAKKHKAILDRKV